MESVNKVGLTPDEVAMRLGVSSSVVRKWLGKGTLRGVRVGKLWRVPEQAIKQWFDSNNPPGRTAQARAEQVATAWGDRCGRDGCGDPHYLLAVIDGEMVPGVYDYCDDYRELEAEVVRIVGVPWDTLDAAAIVDAADEAAERAARAVAASCTEEEIQALREEIAEEEEEEEDD